MNRSMLSDIQKSIMNPEESNGFVPATPRLSTGGSFSLPQPIEISDSSGGTNIIDMQNAIFQSFNDMETTMAQRYDALMSSPIDVLKSQGYYVTTDSGSIFDASGTSYLPIDWIQSIENQRGNAGALLMHFQEPETAKNTAGFEGGSSTTWTGNPPPVDAPVIPDVQVLPPVTKSPDGTAVFTDDTSVTIPQLPGNIGNPMGAINNGQADPTTGLIPGTDTPGSAGTNTGIVPQDLQAALQGMTGGKSWMIWFVIAAVAIFLIIKYMKK